MARRKRQVTTGRRRDELRREAVRLYVEEKLSVRGVAEAIDRSYGTAQRLLQEAAENGEVELRPANGRRTNTGRLGS